MTEPPCQSGDRIELIAMPNDPNPVPPGTQGTVIGSPYEFQNRWQIDVKWDIDQALGLCVPPDQFRIVGKEVQI